MPSCSADRLRGFFRERARGEGGARHPTPGHHSGGGDAGGCLGLFALAPQGLHLEVLGLLGEANSLLQVRILLHWVLLRRLLLTVPSCRSVVGAGRPNFPQLPLVALGLPPEARGHAGGLRHSGGLAVGPLCVAFALGMGGPRLSDVGVLVPVAPHVLDGDARALPEARADHLGQGVPVLQVLRVLLPCHHPVRKLLGHDHIPLVRLQHDVGTPMRTVALHRMHPMGSLHILCDLDDPLTVTQSPILTSGLCRSLRLANGEHCTNGLLAVVLLGGAHLEAAKPVYAEPDAILGAAVEHRRCGLQHMLERRRLSLVVGARVQQAALKGLAGRPHRHSAAGDLECGPPG
mmetsp:Transcript_71923/g.232697  ORF Transcript_71923/g.232697 Transcript_71923/m.232697 type:complete len:347 (+) Transcript_71923:37-1077(+)